MNLARVFPRRTKATPVDDMAFVGVPPTFALPEIDKVHISASFTWDIPEAERLASEWERVAPVEIGGPAYKTPAEEFMPGKYLRRGYIITSRGCPKRCWFCPVWKGMPQVVEYPIKDGWLVQDDNLLACSDSHISGVFEMLMKQKRSDVQFTGGIEPAFLKDWHVDLFAKLNPGQIFSAYDTPDDLEPLRQAGRMFQDAGFTFKSRKLRCYVLCGYKGDTIDAALKRMHEAVDAGFWPMGMLWMDLQTGKTDKTWSKFQRTWARMAAIYRVLNPRPLPVTPGPLFR